MCLWFGCLVGNWQPIWSSTFRPKCSQKFSGDEDLELVGTRNWCTAWLQNTGTANWWPLWFWINHAASHPPNPLQSTHVQRRSGASHRLSTTVHHPFQKASLVWSHNACWSGNRSLPSTLCRHQQPSTGLEMIKRTPGTHRDHHCWGQSEIV